MGALTPAALVLRAQVLAGVTCAAFYAAMTTSVSIWKAAGWEGWRIGAAVAFANLSYAVFVALGGRAADRWGSRKAGTAGAIAGLIASVAATLHPSPAVALAGSIAVGGAGALCFPSLARWIAGANDRLQLHEKVSRYNLGWAGGELAGFLSFAALAGAPRRTGFGLATIMYVVLVAGFAWTRRSPGKLRSGTDGGAKPLPGPLASRFALTGRLGLLLACALSNGMMAQAEKSIGEVLGDVEARRLAGVLLASFATAMIGAFIVASRWTGWILRPKLMLLCQGGLVLGAAGLIIVAGDPGTASLVGCGALVGTGFGAAYTSSLYYSLRLPHGTGRAAGIHETFIGVGNTIGPIACGMILDAGIGGGGLASVGTCALLLAGASAVAQLGLTSGISLSGSERRRMTA